jgi:hypothetical protein
MKDRKRSRIHQRADLPCFTFPCCGGVWCYYFELRLELYPDSLILKKSLTCENSNWNFS